MMLGYCAYYLDTFSDFFILIFFFKQKTAYEILSGLVGSEMCIRDSTCYLISALLLVKDYSEGLYVYCSTIIGSMPKGHWVAKIMER